MARERLIALRERRARLVDQAERERVVMLAAVERGEAAAAWFERGAEWFERGAALLRRIRANPQWIVAGVVLLVMLRPRRALKWLGAGVSLWRTWRSLRGLVPAFVADLLRGQPR